MSSTSVSLLERLQRGGRTEEWTGFVELYESLIRGWLAPYHLPSADLDDIVQEVLAVLVRKLPEFDRQRTGSFRHWLRLVTANCLKRFWRSRQRRPVATGESDAWNRIAQLEDPESGLSQMWNEQYDRVVLQKLLDEVRSEFKETTWRAFVRIALDAAAPAEVAAELGLSVNAVMIAKSRVLKRLREEGTGLLD